jgi:ABC-2 type transport system permease protein
MTDLLTYEWRRARSIRTTWITSGFLVAAVAAFCYLTVLALESTDEQGLPLTDIVQQSITVNPVVLVLLASLGAMAFGHEYRYGTIRLTLTAFPRRPGVFAAKLVMTMAIALAVMIVSVLVGMAIAAVAGAQQSGSGISWVTLAWQVSVFAATYAGLAFTLTVITRNHPIGIVGPLLLTLLESAVIAILGERFEWLPRALPLTAMQNWFAGVDVGLSVAVLAAWMGGLLVASFVLLQRRDA